jgi:hypothetical protein
MGASFKPLYGNGLQNAVWKMSEDYWRRINGYDQIDKVIRGVEFNDGEVVNEDELKEEEKGKDAA